MNQKESDLRLLKSRLGDWNEPNFDPFNEMNKERDTQAQAEGAPYHETAEARIMAFKNGWDACFNHLIKGLNAKR